MFEDVSELIQTKKAFRSPCCKFRVCPVCFWEDDGQDEHDAEQVQGGPNGALILRMAQENFKKFGASEKSFIAKVRKPVSEEL